MYKVKTKDGYSVLIYARATVAEMTTKEGMRIIAEANPYHDELGRFTHGTGTGGAGKGPILDEEPNEAQVNAGAAMISRAYAKDSGGAGDPAMAAIQKKMGYDKKPKIVSKNRVEKTISDGGTEMYRGVSEARFIDQYFGGDLHAGAGYFGSGTYFAKDLMMAAGYAKDSDTIFRAALPKKAKMIEVNELYTKMDDFYNKGISKGIKSSKLEIVLGNSGRFAAMLGYDGITADVGTAAEQYVVFNRGIVMVQEGPARG